jgi:hypothetical protein
MNGKGDKQRKRLVPKKQYDESWERTFGKKGEEKDKLPATSN